MSGMVATIEHANTEDITSKEPNTSNTIDICDAQTTIDKETTVCLSPSVATSEEIVCTEVLMSNDTPENARETTTTATPPRTTSSRYILDKQKITEDSFSKDFEDAMNFLQSISPIRGNSMTFQREKEGDTQKSTSQAEDLENP